MSTKDVIPVGSEIISVSNIPVSRYIDQYVRPYISQSADYILEDSGVDYLLDGFLGDTVTVGFRKPDKSIHSMLLKREAKNIPWQYATSNTLFELKQLPGDIVKIDLNSFDTKKIIDTFQAALPVLKKAKAIIIDIRKNGGGNSDHSAAILSYFTDNNFIQGSKWFTREHRASYKAWGAFAARDPADTSEWSRKARDYFYGRVWYEGGQMTRMNMAPKNDRMTTVPLVVLLGHSTASAAEDFLIMLDGLKGRATTIGQRSFASTGQPMSFELPGGGSARICTKKDTYPDGRVFVGVGIKPDIEVNPTVEDYLKNQDKVLERAINLLKGK
jgi:carboxyl-terminal processing protease